MNKDDRIKLSVALITYNQERYIEQALMSVVEQETSFDYEIVVGEDSSQDRTGEIVKQIKDEYPEKIRVLERTHNLGPFRNALDVLQKCKGQYIASLEGDDYWTDHKKLQKQVDYLDKHPDHVMCFSYALEFFEDGSHESYKIGPSKEKQWYTLQDVLDFDDNLIPTCTVMYRNGLIKSFPEWFTQLNQSDWSTYIILSKLGPVGFLPEILAARRIHGNGIWSGKAHESQLRMRIDSLNIFDEYLKYEYHNLISQLIKGFEFKIAVDLEFQGDLKGSAAIFLANFPKFLLNKYIKKKELLKLAIKYCMPKRTKEIFRKYVS